MCSIAWYTGSMSKGHRQTETNFSLKDQLFNKPAVSGLAKRIKAVYPQFKEAQFVKHTVTKFPELELKQRLSWIRENLRTYLPDDYRKAVTILLNSLPEECDPHLSDDDFGEFIYAPYGEFVAIYGCTKKELAFSLNALEQITTRFSAEEAIRYFINAFPEETMKRLHKWATHKHYHVRRLVSEGTRPKLPWCIGIELQPGQAMPLLDVLYTDSTRYVTRSVANHLNDISKTNPQLVVDTLHRWQKAGGQQSDELAFIVKHSLRTLVKQGNPAAMQVLGYSPKPHITVQAQVAPTVAIGQALEFGCSITAQRTEPLLIDYAIGFQTKSGKVSYKVFKWKQATLKKGETLELQKKHAFKIMTTRTLYPGKHTLSIQANGTVQHEAYFNVTEK